MSRCLNPRVACSESILCTGASLQDPRRSWAAWVSSENGHDAREVVGKQCSWAPGKSPDRGPSLYGLFSSRKFGPDSS